MPYAEKRKDLVDIIHVSFDELYYIIGEWYDLLPDTAIATQYLQKMLNLNASHEKAKALLKKLQAEE